MAPEKKSPDTFYGIEWIWNLGPDPVHFFVVQTTFGKARKYFKPLRYNAETGEGVQRQLIPKWVKKLKSEMATGNYTPCAGNATLTKEHFDKGLVDRHHRKIKLTGDIDCPISLTDSQHRFASLEEIRKESAKMQQKVDQLPITIQVNINTDPVKDFLNLQKGRPTDKTHVLSMKITKGLVENNKKQIYQDGLSIAKLLDELPNSPFFKKIKTETIQNKCIPLNSVMAENASDISTSLIGAGRILQLTKGDVEHFAKLVITGYDLLLKNSPQLFEQHKLLCLPPNGTKGAATILIGIAMLVAYAENNLNYEDFFADDDNVADFLDCCEEVFTRNANNNLSGPSKRQIMGEFAKALFKNIPDELCHEGIPKELLTLLSTSAYNVSALPKTKSAPRKKKKKEINVIELDNELTVMNEELPEDADVCLEDSEDDGFYDIEQEGLTNSESEI